MNALLRGGCVGVLTGWICSYLDDVSFPLAAAFCALILLLSVPWSGGERP